jgi:hypothetical protein
MSMKVYDENCHGCKPTMIDPRTRTALGPKIWHGQMMHGYLVVWDDCKDAAFVVGNSIRKLAKE